MSIFSDAYAEMLGTGETGQTALARFYKDIGTGSIESAKILPIVARMMQERAAPKLDVMKKTSIAEQARFQNALADITMTGSKSGVEQGFSNVWKGFADGIKGITPLVRGLAGSFEDFTKLIRPFTRSIGQLNDLFASFSKYTGIAEKNLVNLALVGGLMMTKWGKVGLIFSAIAVVLEDISMGINGEGESVTGYFLDWLDEGGIKLGAFERALFGVSAGLLAIATGMAALKGFGLIPGISNAKRGLPTLKSTPVMSPLAMGGMSLAAGHFMLSGVSAARQGFNTTTDEYRQRYGLNFGKDSLIGDLGVRTLGVMSDFGNALTGGLASKFGEWLGGAVFEAVEQAKEWKDSLGLILKSAFDQITEAFKQALRSILPEATHAWLGLAQPAGPGTTWNVGRQGQSVTFGPGAITINAPGADAQVIADELLDIISGNYNQVLQSTPTTE